jgi:hypothetical protein
VVDVKTLRKPFTTLEAVNYVRRHLELPEMSDENFDLYGARSQIGEAANQHQSEQVRQLRTDVEAYRAKYQIRVPPKAEESETETQLRAGRAIDKFNARLDQQLAHVRKTLETFPSGTPTRIVTANGSVFYGITARVWSTDPKGNPTAPNNWKKQFLLADPAKELTIPLSKVNTGVANAIAVTPKEYDFFEQPIYEVFDQRQQKNREERQVFTGNILRAMEKFNGKMINYTNAGSKTCQGVLTPPEFDIEKALERTPISIAAPNDVMRFLFEVTNRTGQLKTPDEVLIVRAQRKRDGNGIMLQAPRAKEEGGQYYLNQALMEAAGGGEFFSVGKKMMLVVPPERIESVIYYLNAQDLTLAAFEQRQKAREMMGVELPQLELVNQDQFAAQADYVPFVPDVDAQVRATLEQNFNGVTEADLPVLEAPLAEQASEGIVSEAIALPEVSINEISSNQPALNSAEFWSFQLSQLSDELKQLLSPAQISNLLSQPDPIAAIAALQETQPLFASVYEELTEFYLAIQSMRLASNATVLGEPSMSNPTIATNSAQTIDSSVSQSDSAQQQIPQTAQLEQQLIDGLQQILQSWALTPIDAHKAPYRAGWQTESALSQGELIPIL